MPIRRLLQWAVVLPLAAPIVALQAPAATAAPVPLIGTFAIAPGSCAGGVASGTYLRMVLSGGSNAAGPYFSNSDSSCPDNTYTPLSPGSARGLATGTYQPEPTPAFDSAGNALSAQITTPVAFEGVKFATATNPVDPQTGRRVPAPAISSDGGALSGNLEAFAVSWNNQQFNQGSPKPGGATPGNTTPVSGTYDASTGAYTLEWSSQVVGGPFNGFSAFWHLTGTFTPAPSTSSASAHTVSPTVTGASAAPTSPNSAAASRSVPGSPAAAAGTVSSTTSTTATPAATGSPGTRLALTSQTTSTGPGGWDSPTWLIALLALLAALGLAGVVWSERTIRQQGELR